jgi:hypothetical protein
MFDLAQPNDAPGKCVKCNGSGEYAWGGSTNGKPSKTGTCFSCRGTGAQCNRQIARNRAYNRHKINLIASEG